MNIVYGGSFNPPTIAHKKIVLKLHELFKPQNILIVPTGDSYTWKNITPFYHRLNMTRLAFPNDKVLDIEQNKKYRGTINTLRYLSRQYDDLYFTMGADNLIYIKKWINYEALLNEFNFIIFKRDEIDIEAFITNELSNYKDKFTIVDFNMNISATKFRSTHASELVDPCVLDYIKTNGLYKED